MQAYIYILLSQYVSLLGSQIVSFAVIWYLTIESESALILSVSSIASIVPMILVGPIAGVLADRMNKNVLLIVTDLIQALATLVLIILFNAGIATLWHIIVLMAVRGACQGFQNPVSSVVAPLMVPEDKIKAFNSVQQIFNSLLNIAAPALGAIAIANFAIEQIYWLDVFTFIPTAIVLMLIRIPSVHPTSALSGSSQDADLLVSSEGIEDGNKTKKSSISDGFKEGLRYIKDSGLGPVFVMFATANFIVVPIFTLFPLLILDHHSGGATQYSWVEILFQAGIIIGAVLLMSSKRPARMKGVVMSGIALSFVLLAFGLIPRGWFWLIYIACFGLGINLAFIDTQLMSVLQTKIPKNIQGRVFATMFTLIKSLNPLGLILWGVIGEIIPVVLCFIISPVVSLIVYGVMIKTTNMMQFGEKFDNNNSTNQERENTISSSPKSSLDLGLDSTHDSSVDSGLNSHVESQL